MRAIAGAILIHAGCTLMAAGGMADDLSFMPIVFGAILIFADLLIGAPKPAAPPPAPKDE
jgi:hypothetical protein